MNKYRIEKNRNRQESFDGAKPLEILFSSTRADAVRKMKRLADGGQYYAAVFIGRYGECIEESST